MYEYTSSEETAFLRRKRLKIKCLVLATTYFRPRRTIIGTTALNGSVRNGKRCDHRVKSPRRNIQLFVGHAIENGEMSRTEPKRFGSGVLGRTLSLRRPARSVASSPVWGSHAQESAPSKSDPRTKGQNGNFPISPFSMVFSKMH